MSLLPRVTATTRERIARELEDFGPAACVAEATENLERHNPEFLDMAVRCAGDVGEPARIMVGFAMFYRLLIAQSPVGTGSMLSPLPRVTPKTRNAIVQLVDRMGTGRFVTETIAEIERDNPELLQAAHGFAVRHEDYLGIMQGFALLYRSLAIQSEADRVLVH